MTANELRAIRLTLFAAAIAIALFIPFAFLAPSGVATIVALQVCWAGMTALGGWILGRVPERAIPFVTGCVAVLTPALYAPMVAMGGGLTSPLFAWLVAMPLGLVVVFRSLRLAVGLGALATLLVTISLSVATRADKDLALLRAMQVATSGAVAWIGCIAFATGRSRELAAEREREAAKTALAEEALRRERSERMAAVGQLAAGLAHEVNNPLGFMKSNLEFLEAAMKDGAKRDIADERAALTDCLEGLARIQAVVEELRRVVAAQRGETNQGQGPLEPTDPKDVRYRVPLQSPPKRS